MEWVIFGWNIRTAKNIIWCRNREPLEQKYNQLDQNTKSYENKIWDYT